MLLREKEETGGLINLEDLVPLDQDDQFMARRVDPDDPSIFGNEFEVPQEKTLNTEDFQFTGLPTNQQKPKLYVGPTEGFFQTKRDSQTQPKGNFFAKDEDNDEDYDELAVQAEREYQMLSQKHYVDS